MKVEDNKYIILFLRVCMLSQEEVLAELRILESDDSLGDRAQILFNREVTESITCNCIKVAIVYVNVYII